MLKDLERIQTKAAEILGDYPEKRANLLQAVRNAEETLQTAKAEQEAAEDLAQYDKAAERAKRAELALHFAKATLEKLENAPRMEEADYMKALTTCRDTMEKAAKAYREKATALMDQLKALTDEYKQTAKDTNETLIKLDKAANVLQSKYGREKKGIAVKENWLRYALRYDNGKPCAMATLTEPQGTLINRNHDSILCAAWLAMDKAYPKEIF